MDFHGSLRARDGGRLLGQDPPAVVFQGISRDGRGRRDLAGLVGQGGSDAGQVGADGVEVNGVFQAAGEAPRSGNVTAGTAGGDARAGTQVRSAL
jgi:hypothetical protein